MEMRMTKLDQAVEALKSNQFKTNAEFVEFLMSTLKMSKLGARTYAYNARKALGTTLEAAKKATKARYVPTAVDPAQVDPTDQKAVLRLARFLHATETDEVLRDIDFDATYSLRRIYIREALSQIDAKSR